MSTYQNLKNQGGKISPLVLFQWFLFLCAILIGIFWLIPYLKRLKDNQDTKTQSNTIENDVKIQNVKAEIQTPEQIKEVTEKLKSKYNLISKDRFNQISASAKVISLELGTAPSQTGYFGFPKMFWEDEEAVVKELKKYPGIFSVLAEVYQTVYTKNRILVDDLHKYLSDSELNEVRSHYLRVNKRYKYF